jgi:hypothetical protein
MGHYDFRFRQKVVFEGPSNVDVFDPGLSPHGFMSGRMYDPEPDRQMREGEFKRKLLEHAANKVVESVKAERAGGLYANPRDIDLGPLGVLKNVYSIISVNFHRDLEIEYEGWLKGEIT